MGDEEGKEKINNNTGKNPQNLLYRFHFRFPLLKHYYFYFPGHLWVPLYYFYQQKANYWVLGDLVARSEH